MHTEKTLHHAVVCLLLRNGEVNLPFKKKHIGAGFRNGYGGGIEKGETPAQAAVRETLEEAGVKTWVEDLTYAAKLTCYNRPERGEPFICIVYVFTCDWWLGEPRETDEMGPPEWFAITSLPMKDLLWGDRAWLPLLLSGDTNMRFLVDVWYGPHQQMIDRPTVIHTVDFLPVH